MNTRTILTALLAAGAAGADLTAQAPSTAAPQTEMQKWIATTDAQWQEAFKKGVTEVHEAELNKVKLQYLNLLEGAIDKASKANDLKGAVALRDEQKRFGDTQHFPEQDDAADAAAVKQVRAAIRAQLAKANADRDARAKALHAKYDQFLAQTQTQLTQAKRLDDALAVQAKRDEVKGAWTGAMPAIPTQKPNPITPPPVASSKGSAVTPAERELKAAIPANSPNGFSLGAVRKGTKISLQYVSGKWKAWGTFASYTPDQETRMERGDISRLAIALPASGTKGGHVLAVVPANTVQRPFVFEVTSDYPELVLRINDRENSFSENPGTVEYSVRITSGR